MQRLKSQKRGFGLFFVYLSKAGEKEAPLQFGVKVHFV